MSSRMFRVTKSLISNLIGNRSVLVNNFRRSMSENVSGPVIGIDLGTTNSCVATMEGTEPRVIVNAEGHRTTPSVVAFLEDGSIIVGESAKRQAVSNSRNTLYGTKRLIGRRFRDSEVQAESKHLPFELVEAKHGDVWFKVRGKEYSPSQIGAYVLGKMRDTAQSYMGQDIKNAVVTVPAYFNDSQRQATKDAGTIAGLNVVRIINEPTAAALAYGLNKKNINKTIAVYDLGGGTFDISILEINDGVFEVKSTNGDTRLGGEDFDNVIIKFLIDNVNQKLNINVQSDLKALQRLKEAAEKAKTELSFTHVTEINLPYLVADKSFSLQLTRSKLEELVGDLIERTIKPCRTALNDAKLAVESLDEIILVGGMTRMPKVQQAVQQFFKKQPSKGVNPDEAVAIGAAIQGGVLVGSVSDIVLVDAAAFSLGVKTLGDVFSIIIPKSSTIPTRKCETFTTSEDNQTYVDVSIYQGERSMCADNLHLGDFRLGPIPPRPRGHSRVEITIELDQNGIMHVSAVELESNVKAQTTLRSNPRGLSKEELAKMAKEAEAHREADQKRKNIAMIKTECESTIYDIRKYLRENETKIESKLSTDFSNKVTEISNKLFDTNQDEKFYLSQKNELSQLFFEVKKAVSESNPQTESQNDSSSSTNSSSNQDESQKSGS